MTVWTPNNCPLASADLLSEVYFGKSHFLPLHKGYRPHLGKCDFDETFISGALNRTKREGAPRWKVGRSAAELAARRLISGEAGGDIEVELTSDPLRNALKCHPLFFFAITASAVALQRTTTFEID